MMHTPTRYPGIRWLLGLALFAGLTVAQADGTAPATPAPADPAVWGVYSQLLDRQWQDEKGKVLAFKWIEPGEEMVEYWPGGFRTSARIRRDPATGTLRYREDDLFTPVFVGRVGPDGSVQFENDTLFKNGFRVTLRPGGELHRESLKFKGGEVTVNPKYSTSYRSIEGMPATVQAPAPSLAAAPAAEAGPPAAPEPSAGAQARAGEPSIAAGRAVDKRWEGFGPLARFIGLALWDEANEDMLIVQGTSEGIRLLKPDRSATDFALEAILTSNWRGKPILTRIVYGLEGFKQGGETLPDGAIRYHYSNMLYGADFTDTFSLQPDGGLRWEQDSKGGDSDTVLVRTYVALDEKDDAQARAKAQRHADKNRRLGTDTDSFNREVAALRARDAEQRAREEQEKAGGGGMLRSLIGAAVAGGMASAGGLDSDQVMGAALKGAQIFNPDSAGAAALGAAGDQMLGTGGAGSAAGLASAASSSGGSLGPKENLALGACAGFTESNYRQKAVSGGGDQQLYAMCGQAFEYYTMYKRAIAQGYSEADAERTYMAHRQSAQVAEGYLQSHGAN